MKREIQMILYRAIPSTAYPHSCVSGTSWSVDIRYGAAIHCPVSTADCTSKFSLWQWGACAKHTVQLRCLPSSQDIVEYAKSLSTAWWSKTAFSFSSLIRSGQCIEFEPTEACELFECICQDRAAFLAAVWRAEAETPHRDIAVIAWGLCNSFLRNWLTPAPSAVE